MVSPFVFKDVIIEKFVIIFSGADVYYHEVVAVSLMKIMRDVFDWVPISRLNAWCWECHGNNSVSYVGEIELFSVPLKFFLWTGNNFTT